MQSQDAETLSRLVAWLVSGEQAALVTVARTWGSAPRPVGAWLALRADGVLAGSVSGGCIEDDLIARMREGRLAGKFPIVLRYGATAEEAQRFGLPCGGTLELVVEPAPDVDALAELNARVQGGEFVRRTLDLTRGVCTLEAASASVTCSWDGARLTTLHGPRRRLLLIGAGPISRSLAHMAPALDYTVSVCDPREDYRAAWDLPAVPLVAGMPDEAVLAMQPDAATAIVALTHDPKLDDMALLEALKSAAFYVGALGSMRSTARRKERLLDHFDLTAEQVARLHGPVGLRIGSRTPPEIAVAILAELVAVSRGVTPA